MLNICSAKFDFISGCVSFFIYSVYRVLKDLCPISTTAHAPKDIAIVEQDDSREKTN